MDLFNPNNLMQVLEMLKQSDTEIIRKAEKVLKPFSKDPNSVNALLQQIRENPDEASRLHASLLLKKKIAKHYKKFSPDAQTTLRNTLLFLVTNDPVYSIKTAIAGCIASLAKTVFATLGNWAELFQLLMQLAQDPNTSKRSLTYKLISQLSEHVSAYLLPHTNTITQMFIAGCQDADEDVAREAITATTAFMSSICDKPEVEILKVVITPILTVITNELNKGEDSLVPDGLQFLEECATLEKTILNDHIEVAVQLIISILDNQNVDPSLQQSAGSTLITLIENRPKLISKKNLVAPVISSLVKIIAKSDASAAGTLYTMGNKFDNTDENDEDAEHQEEEDIVELAQACLDVMACNISSKHFSQPALAICADCFVSPDPKIRKAGGSLLGIISEGCNDAIKPILNQIVPQLLNLTRDADLHVREAATFAAGQIAEHCQPDILFFHESVLPALFLAMEDSQHTVQGTACYVVEFFCENLDREVLKPYLHPLLTRLGALLSNSDKTTIDMALAAIASTAVAAEGDFLPYAQAICQVLDNLIFLTEPSMFQIRGRALECLGHIALGIGGDNFMQLPYFERGMASITEAEAIKDESLREFSYVFISNCSKAMGNVFIPRLPSIVPILLDVISESDILPGDDENENDDKDYVPGEEEDEEDQDVYIKVEEGYVNTKKAAVGALGALAEHCSSAFGPYVKRSFEIIATEGMGSVWSYHKIVRSESLSTLPLLMGVVCKEMNLPTPVKGQPLSLPQETIIFASEAIKTCLRVIEDDDEKIVVANACDAIGGILNIMGVAALLIPNQDSGKTFADQLMGFILLLLSEKACCQKKVEQDEDDSDDNHDNNLMDSVCDLIGSVAKCAGPIIIPFFDTFFELLLKFTRESRPYTDRSMAIGCIGEVLGEIGENAVKYAGSIFPVIVQGLQDSTEAVRRNSAFCVGVLIESTGTALVEHFPSILQMLHPVCIRTCDLSGASDSGGADIDNAISAVARMVKFAPSSLPLPQVLSMILSSLPLKADFNEGLVVYGCLCDLLDSNHPAATPLIKEFLVVFGKSLKMSKIEDDVKMRIISTLYNLNNNYAAGGSQFFIAALQTIDPENQLVIQQALASYKR